MESIQKQYRINDWEYYLAMTLCIIATIALVAAALHVFGLI